MFRKLCSLAALTVALGLVATAPAIARPSTERGPALGPLSTRSTSAGAHVLGGGNLSYHGGRVMRTNTTYAIHWLPYGYVMPSGYRSTIDRYFADAAADSGRTSNVYSTETQYYDATGPIAYNQRFGGATTSVDPFPANGCPRYDGLAICLTDSQVVHEIEAVAARKGWTAGSTHAFLLFLPRSVGTCMDTYGRACAFTSFCAYHSWLASRSGNLVYANVPYADTDRSDCSTGQRPNGTDADDTINTASHEHREMIEDPFGNAWYDGNGYEGADKCAWIFGRATGSTSSGLYNQTINGDHYYLQEEWSNARAGCVQRGI